MAKNIQSLVNEKIELINNFDDTYPSNPDDILTGGFSEYGKTGYEIYSEIARDSKVSGVEKIIRRTIFSADWDVFYPNEDDANDEITDFIKENFNNIENDDFTNILKNLMDARIYGFKVAEKVFKYENNKMMLKYLKCFESEIFDFQKDNYNNLIGVVLKSGQTKYETIPVNLFVDKFIHFIYPYVKDGNFYGTSAYYPIYETWRRKQRLNLITPIAFELRGIPPVKNIYNQSASKGVRDSIETVLKNIKNASKISVPAQYNAKGDLTPLFDIEFMQGGQVDFNAFIKQIDEYDKDISRTLGLPDDLGYTSTENGSNAKARTQIRVFYDMILDEQRKLERVVNKQLVKQIIDLNYGIQDTYPVFSFVREDFDTMANKIALIKELKASGIPVTDEYIQKFLDIPMKEKEDVPVVVETPKSQPTEIKQGDEPNQEIVTEEKDVKEFASQSSFQTGIYKPTITWKRDKYINRADYQKIDDFYDKIETGYSVRFVRELNKARYDMLKQSKKLDSILEFPAKYKNNNSKYLYALAVRSFLDGKLKGKNEMEKAGVEKFKNQETQYVADWILSEVDQYKKDELMNIQDVLQEYLDKGVTLTPAERKRLTSIKTFATLWSTKLSDDVTNKINLMKSTINPDIMSQNKIAEIINDEFSKYTALISQNDINKFIPVSQLTLPYINTVIRTNSSAYFNRGRYQIQTAPEVADVVTAVKYSAILDGRTTWFCQEHHGEILKIGDPQLDIIYPPNHYNCRSLCVPMFYDDDYKADWGNKSMQTTQMQEAYSTPAQGFGGTGGVDIPASQKVLEGAK